MGRHAGRLTWSDTLQGDRRTYSYVVGLSSAEEPTNWEDLMRLAKLIPKICHNINRWAPHRRKVPGPRGALSVLSALNLKRQLSASGHR